MKRIFTIEDDAHAEAFGEDYRSFSQALAEVRRLAAIPWDVAPNLAPCMSWATCGRDWAIVEVDASKRPWTALDRKSVLQVRANGTRWLLNDDDNAKTSDFGG